MFWTKVFSATLCFVGMFAMAGAQPPEPGPVPAPQPVPPLNNKIVQLNNPVLPWIFSTKDNTSVNMIFDTRNVPNNQYFIMVWVQKDVNGVWTNVQGHVNFTTVQNEWKLLADPLTIGSLGVGTYCVCGGATNVATGEVVELNWQYFDVIEPPPCP